MKRTTIQIETLKKTVKGYRKGDFVSLFHEKKLYPVFTPKEFAKKVVQDKQCYFTWLHAFYLKEEIDQHAEIIGCLYQWHGKDTYKFIYQMNDSFPLVNKKEFYFEEEVIKKEGNEELAQNSTFVGYSFLPSSQLYTRMFSFSDPTTSYINTMEEGYAYAHELKKVPEILPHAYIGKKKTSDSSFKSEPVYDIASFCSQNLLIFINSDKKLPKPFVFEDVFRFQEPSFYKGKEKGYTYILNKAFGKKEYLRFYHLKEICQQHNLLYLSNKQFSQKELSHYFKRNQIGYFPSSWQVRKSFVFAGFLRDGKEVWELPGGITNYFTFSTPQPWEIVIPFTQLGTVYSLIRQTEPRAITEDYHFIFDTRNNKEWANFRLRYLMK